VDAVRIPPYGYLDKDDPLDLVQITGTVLAIEIVFDEGQDILPDHFGLAVLDNININGTRVGRK
jgi:hypothetical protein